MEKLILIILSSCLSYSIVNAQIKIDKTKAVQKYHDEYLPSELKGVGEIKWKGNVDNCDEGHVSDKIHQKALMRINYFRTLCGLNSIQFKEEYNVLAQKAALIIYANNQLSHDPDKSWKCYSKEGHKGAENSSLGYIDFVNSPSIAFLTVFIKDYGEANKGVGHRRSILYSRSAIKGFGATTHTLAVYNDHTSWLKKDSTLLPKYFSYPVSGYNEVDLVFPRWSFSIPDIYNVDFSECLVDIRDEDGKSIAINVLPYESIYDPTIVWEMKDRFKREYFLKHKFTVALRNVKVDNTSKNFSYEVVFFDYENDKD